VLALLVSQVRQIKLARPALGRTINCHRLLLLTYLCTDPSVSAAGASNSTTSEALGPDKQMPKAKRGKYKAYSVKEKKLIVQEARESMVHVRQLQDTASRELH